MRWGAILPYLLFDPLKKMLRVSQREILSQLGSMVVEKVVQKYYAAWVR
jgi:hypothetical protein